MKLVGRVHVEPLDDERWTNIERRVVTGASDAAARGVDRAARSSGLTWALAIAGVAVIALVAGAIGWRMHAPDAGRLPVATTGEPGTLRLDGGVLDIGDARIASDAKAAYSITRDGGGVQVHMARGRIELEVGKRGSRPPLVVEAGDTEVIVVGTHFSVAYDPDTGAVDVRVTEGVVRVVRKHHDEARVAAGQQWSSGAGVVASAEPAAPQAQVEPKPAQQQATAPTAPPPQPQPPPQVADAGSNVARPRPAAGSAGVADDPHVDLKTRIRAAPLLAPLDVGTTDPKAAVDAYTRIFTSDTGKQAAHALYSIAWVQYSRQGRAGDALTTIDRIVKRFEGFEYRAQYAAALWLRVRIRCLGAGIDDACRHAAYIYLHQAPDGAAAALAEDITLAH